MPVHEYINVIINGTLALIVFYHGLLFFYKKQELGVAYIRFGSFVNSAIFFVIVFAGQLAAFFGYGDGMRVEQIIYAVVLFLAIYLSFQKNTIAENGIICPPFHVFMWEEIDCYQWGDPLDKSKGYRLLFYIYRNILFFRWTSTYKMEVPLKKKKKVRTLLNLYASFKEKPPHIE